MVIVEEKCILHVAWDNPIARGKWRLKKTAAGSEIAGSKSYNGNQIMSQMFKGWIFCHPTDYSHCPANRR